MAWFSFQKILNLSTRKRNMCSSIQKWFIQDLLHHSYDTSFAGIHVLFTSSSQNPAMCLYSFSGCGLHNILWQKGSPKRRYSITANVADEKDFPDSSICKVCKLSAVDLSTWNRGWPTNTNGKKPRLSGAHTWTSMQKHTSSLDENLFGRSVMCLFTTLVHSRFSTTYQADAAKQLHDTQISVPMVPAWQQKSETSAAAAPVWMCGAFNGFYTLL